MEVILQALKLSLDPLFTLAALRDRHPFSVRSVNRFLRLKVGNLFPVAASG
jgi:hypothetical protein